MLMRAAAAQLPFNPTYRKIWRQTARTAILRTLPCPPCFAACHPIRHQILHTQQLIANFPRHHLHHARHVKILLAGRGIQAHGLQLQPFQEEQQLVRLYLLFQHLIEHLQVR